jgi:WD40 repeat protein
MSRSFFATAYVLLLPALLAGPAFAAEAGPRLDAFGDPLPERAVARIGTLRLRQPSSVVAVAFSPDGKLLATWGLYDDVRLWDALTGKELRRLPFQLGWWAFELAFSPDGRTLVAGGHQCPLVVWDVATGREARRLGSEDDVPKRPCFSPDGKLLAASGKGGVRLWQTDGWKELAPLPTDARAVEVAFADGGRLSVADEKGQFSVWELGARRRRVVRTGPPWGDVHSALSPDGRRFAVAAVGALRVAVLDASTGEERCRCEPVGNGPRPESLCFSPDGKVLAVAVAWAPVQLFDADTGKELPRLAGAQVGLFAALAFSPDGTRLAVGSGHGVRLWDLATGKELLASPEVWHSVGTVAFSPDGKRLAFAEEARLHVHDATTRRPVWRGEPEGALSGLAFAPDGKTLAAFGPRVARLHDAATGRLLSSCPELEDRIMPGLLLPDLTAAVSMEMGLETSRGPTPEVRVWDVFTGKERLKFRHGRNFVQAACVSPDGRFLALGFYEGPVRLFHLGTGAEAAVFAATSPAWQGLRFTPDGRALASAESAGLVRLLESATGAQRLSIRAEEDGAVGLAFSPGGGVLATWPRGRDGRRASFPVRLWDALTGRELGRLDGHRGRVNQAAFAPDGKTLATAGDDTTVLIWDIADLVQPAAPTALPAQELAAAWDGLADADADRARRGMAALRGAGPQAVGLLRDRLRPAEAPPPEQVRRWIKDLDSDDFATREAATRELEKRLDLVAPALRAALAAGPSGEAKRRLTPLVEAVEAPWVGDVRPRRAVEVLERIGSPEARQALEALAAGAAEARLTREAQASLRRLPR